MSHSEATKTATVVTMGTDGVDDLDFSDDWEPGFSTESAAEVRAAADEVLAAFRSHVDTVCHAQSVADEDSIDASAEVLRAAFQIFVDKQADHCGEWTPFFDAFDDDDSDDDDEEDSRDR